jgi:hypothetical protein
MTATKTTQRFRRDDSHEAAAAADSSLCPLSDEELDHVAGGGGKTGASTNPVDD